MHKGAASTSSQARLSSCPAKLYLKQSILQSCLALQQVSPLISVLNSEARAHTCIPCSIKT